jgi:hypothetical protein
MKRVSKRRLQSRAPLFLLGAGDSGGAERLKKTKEASDSSTDLRTKFEPLNEPPLGRAARRV